MLAPSPARPAASDCRPTQIRPFINVPVVRTTARARNPRPKKVATPATSPLGSTATPVTMPSRKDRFGVSSRTRRITLLYSALSVCARSAHTAGPLLALSTRFCT